MAEKSKIVVEFSHLPKISRQLREGAADAVEGAVARVEARAKKDAPVRTGHLRSSIKGSTNRGGLRGEVVVGAEYGLAVENGTRARGYADRQPYLRPAVRRTVPELEDALRRLAKGLGR